MVEYLDKLDVAKGLNRCTKCNKSSNLVTLLLFYSKESLSWVYHQTNRVYYNHQGSMTFLLQKLQNCNLWPNFNFKLPHKLDEFRNFCPCT